MFLCTFIVASKPWKFELTMLKKQCKDIYLPSSTFFHPHSHFEEAKTLAKHLNNTTDPLTSFLWVPWWFVALFLSCAFFRGSCWERDAFLQHWEASSSWIIHLLAGTIFYQEWKRACTCFHISPNWAQVPFHCQLSEELHGGPSPRLLQAGR